MNWRLLLITATILLFFTCKNKKSSDENLVLENRFQIIAPKEKMFSFQKIDKRGYKYGRTDLMLSTGEKYPVTWEIYQNPLERSTISLPSNWVVKPQDKVFLFAKPDKLKKDFFIWKKYPKEDMDIELSEFVQYWYESIASDTIEVLLNTNTKIYTFNTNHTGYYFNGLMETDTSKSEIHSFILEDEKNFHELSIKIFSKEKAKVYKLLYDIIIEYVYLNETRIVGNGTGLPEIKEIELGIK